MVYGLSSVRKTYDCGATAPLSSCESQSFQVILQAFLSIFLCCCWGQDGSFNVRGEERRGEAVMASFQLFARHGSGHLGNTEPAAKEKKTREEKRVREWQGEDDGKQGRRAEGRVGTVQTNGEKGFCFVFLVTRQGFFPLVFWVKCKRKPPWHSIRNYFIHVSILT